MARDPGDYGEPESVRPVDFRKPIGRLVLRVGQAARVCGMSPRQFSRWADAGHIPYAGGSSNRTYTYESVEKAALIIQALEKGYSLNGAAEASQAFLDRCSAEQAELEAMPIEELQARIVARAYRLQELASRIRKDPVARPKAAVPHSITRPKAPAAERQPVSTEVTRLIAFFQSHPNTVFNAGQIASLLRRQREEVAEDLETLAGRRFLSRIVYPAGKVYRYLSGR